jgi:hypothetical protein
MMDSWYRRVEVIRWQRVSRIPSLFVDVSKINVYNQHNGNKVKSYLPLERRI